MFTDIKGIFNDDAKDFPKLPTDKQTINPGPAVDATASISSIFSLSSIALWTSRPFLYVI